MDAHRDGFSRSRSSELDLRLVRSLAGLVTALLSTAVGAGAPPAVAGAPASTPVATTLGAEGAPLSIVNLHPGRFMLTNRSSRPLLLVTTARLERRAEDGSWRALEELDAGKGYRLIESCSEGPVAACVQLLPGATLRPVPWSGLRCSAQCNQSCRAEAWEGPGVFRLAVLPCDGGSPVAGPSFSLPAVRDLKQPARSRWGVVGEVIDGRVARLAEPKERWEPSSVSAPAADTIAGLPIRRGTERSLSSEDLRTLLGLLEARLGFDDTVLKKYRVGTLVGFQLMQRVVKDGVARVERVEVVIDFICNKIVAAHGEGGDRQVETSHFDPSRARFLALVRRVFPGDAQLARLR